MPASNGAIRCGRSNGLTQPHDWSERTRPLSEGAEALFVRATERALAQAGLVASDVDVIVTVSSTGVARRASKPAGAGNWDFAPRARVPVFGLGCAGGVSGLSIGARLARAVPGEVVLVVAVELCTLAFRGDRGAKADVISAALFGDGAAALVLRAERGAGPALHRRDRRAHLAGHARHHGLVGRSGRLRRGAVALAAALCRRAHGGAGAPFRQ